MITLAPMEFCILMLLTWYVVPILILFEQRLYYWAKVLKSLRMSYSFHFSYF